MHVVTSTDSPGDLRVEVDSDNVKFASTNFTRMIPSEIESITDDNMKSLPRKIRQRSKTWELIVHPMFLVPRFLAVQEKLDSAVWAINRVIYQTCTRPGILLTG